MVMILVSAMRFMTGPSWAQATSGTAARTAMLTAMLKAAASARFILVAPETNDRTSSPEHRLNLARDAEGSNGSHKACRRRLEHGLAASPRHLDLRASTGSFLGAAAAVVNGAEARGELQHDACGRCRPRALGPGDCRGGPGPQHARPFRAWRRQGARGEPRFRRPARPAADEPIPGGL